MKLTFLIPFLLLPLVASHAASPNTFDITTYGAKGDGQTINTAAIQKAIDACHAIGGGTVLVPKGVFVSGSLQLRSRVTLQIAQDAILRGSPNIADYTIETAELHWSAYWKFAASQWKQCLIYAEDAEEIGIEGPGTIDGQGGRERKVFPNANDPRRPMLIRFVSCRKVTVRHVNLIDPASFTTFFVRSEDVHIERVTIRSRHSPNGDGLDFDGCRRVRIKDCDLATGDDAIGPKTFHPDWPNEDFEISGCRITSRWHAIRIGCESIAPTRRLTLRDCTFTQCQGGIKIEANEGALLEDLSFSGIEMNKVCQPFMVLASRFAFSAHGKSTRPPVGRIRKVRFAEIRVNAGVGDDVGLQTGKEGNGDPFERLCAAVVSRPGNRIEDVSFTNIEFTHPGGGTAEQASRLDVGELLESSNYLKWATPFDGELPASALYLRHVKGVRLENVRITLEKPDARAFIAGDDIEGLTLQGVLARSPAPVPGLAKLADARDVVEIDCRVDCGANVPLLVPPTEGELLRLTELRTRSAALDQEIQQKADQADAAERKAKPNLLIIYADDLGYGDLQCYNPRRGKIPTPHLDKLAAQGMRFTDGHSSSGVCSPSRYTLLTGRYHWRTRLQNGIVGVFGAPLLAPDRVTIATLAKGAGYRTACIGKWHLGWNWPIPADQRPLFDVGKTSPVTTDAHRAAWRKAFSQPIGDGPTAHGFDEYFGVDIPNWPPFCFIENNRLLGVPTEFLPAPLLEQNQASIGGPALQGWKLEPILPALGDRATHFIAEQARAGQPFLLYLPLTSPHTPLAVNQEWRGRSGLNEYADLVMETDALVGRVLQTLDDRGVAENTLVVFTSDNGCAPYIGLSDLETMGHHPSGPLRGAKADAWEGGHRVPFIIRWPGTVKPGSVCGQLVQQSDLLATFAEMLGTKLPDNAGEDSVSLLPLLQGRDQPVRDHGVGTSIGGTPALRSGSWKYIPAPGSGGWGKGGDQSQPVQLYNLEEDLGETRNLAAARPEKVAEMKALLDQLIANGRSTPGTTQKNDVEVVRYPRATTPKNRGNRADDSK
jgi:arylsulfatase A-like enzyme